MKAAVERLVKAIGYPDADAGASGAPFVMRVDGMEMSADEINGNLVLSHFLTDDDSLLPELAGYAAGRILRENAALAVDSGHQDVGRVFLWQSVPADASDRGMVRLFETFADSCEWWRERVDAMRGDTEMPLPANEMMIRP